MHSSANRFGTTCCGSAHAARATTAPGSRHHVGWGEGWSCSWSAGGEGGGRGVMARQGLMRMSPHKWHSNGALHWGMNVFLASMICDDDVSLVGQHHRHSDTCTIYWRIRLYIDIATWRHIDYILTYIFIHWHTNLSTYRPYTGDLSLVSFIWLRVMENRRVFHSSLNIWMEMDWDVMNGNDCITSAMNKEKDYLAGSQVRLS